MNGRRLSLAASLIVLVSVCLIAPPNVLGENPWDPDNPNSDGNNYTLVVDSALVVDTTIVDTVFVNGATGPSGNPVQPQASQTTSTSWIPGWLSEFLFFSSLYLGL